MTPLRIEQETGQASEVVWTLGREKGLLTLQKIKARILTHPAPNTVTITTKVVHLLSFLNMEDVSNAVLLLYPVGWNAPI